VAAVCGYGWEGGGADRDGDVEEGGEEFEDGEGVWGGGVEGYDTGGEWRGGCGEGGGEGGVRGGYETGGGF